MGGLHSNEGHFNTHTALNHEGNLENWVPKSKHGYSNTVDQIPVVTLAIHRIPEV